MSGLPGWGLNIKIIDYRLQVLEWLLMSGLPGWGLSIKIKKDRL